jgi:hypothetical protein
MLINSARDLAYAVNEQLKLGLTARPWNIYAPDETFWWLIPSTEWPAYRYGKFAFSSSKDVPRKALLGLNDAVLEPDKIFAGFNLEKGYGPSALAVNPALNRKPAQIIDPTWLWHELTAPPGSVSFSKTLKTAALEAQVFLYVLAGYVHDRDSTAQSAHDAVAFRVTPTRLEHLVDNGFPIPVLQGCETATDFAQLAEVLKLIDGYHWVDVYVGAHIAKGDVNLHGLNKQVLSKFTGWLR